MSEKQAVEYDEQTYLEMDQNIAFINNFLLEWDRWLELVWENFEWQPEDALFGIEAALRVGERFGPVAGALAGGIATPMRPLAAATDLAHDIKYPDHQKPYFNFGETYGPMPLANAEEALETEAIFTLGELNRQFVILSETLANLNDPLLPEFEQAISDITATIKEAIAQLDACMAAQSCGDSTLADGILPLDELSGEEGSDKGLMGPAFGLMPLVDGAGEAGDQNAQVLEAGLALMDDQSSSPQEAARAVFQDLIPSVEQLDARLGGLFEDIVVNGGDAFESLTSIAKGIIDEFANNVLGNLFQSMGPFGSIVQGVLGAFIPGLAGGGVAQPGAPVLVGERGPELLIPHAPARILNNHITGQMLGGAGGQPMVVNMQNNFQTDVKNAVRAEMMNYSSMLTQATAQTIRNEMNLIYR